MLHGLFAVEFLAEDTRQVQSYFEWYGLRVVAREQDGLGVWLRNAGPVPSDGGVSVIVRQAVTATEKAKLNRSGSCVSDICFLVDNVDVLLQNVREASKIVLEMNVTMSVGMNAGKRFVQLFFPRPGLRHTLIEGNDFGAYMEGWVPCENAEEVVFSSPPLVAFIDHIAIACLGGTMHSIVRWYEKAFSLKQKTGIISIKTELGDGLRLASLYHRVESKNEFFVKLTFVESVAVRGAVENQVTTFLRNHGGPGVQHMAFLTHDIFRARRQLSQSGVQFLAAPPGYYQLPQMAAQADAAGLSLSQLEEGGILFDNEPEKMDIDDPEAPSKYLLQVFTRSPFERSTCFFELITRGNHREGFGAGNIRNLFLAVALERKRNKSSDDLVLQQILAEHQKAPSQPGGLLQARAVAVVVNGATVCGLATALSLARAHIGVVLIGKEPQNEAQFVVMALTTLNVWRRLGIYEEVLSKCGHLSSFTVFPHGPGHPSVEQPQEMYTIETRVLREILLTKLRDKSGDHALCEVRLGHEIVAIGMLTEGVAVHVEPQGPLLAEFVVDAEGLESFWAAHLVTTTAAGTDAVVSLHIASPFADGRPVARGFQLFLNPTPSTESLFVISRQDGSAQLTFAACDTLPDEEQHEEHLARMAEFCTVLGLDKELGLEVQVAEQNALKSACEKLEALEMEEVRLARQFERMAYGLDLAAEQVQHRKNQVANWWTPLRSIPNAALRLVGGSIEREEMKNEDKAARHRALQDEYARQINEVRLHAAEVQKGIVARKAQLVKSMTRVEANPTKYLSKAVDGRYIALVNNNVVDTLLNSEINDALGDVAALGWRLAATLTGDGKFGMLEQYAEERLFVAQVRLMRNQYLSRFFSPGSAMMELRDAVRDAGIDPGWIGSMVEPVSASESISIRGDWNSSLRPASRDFFLDAPVMKGPVSTTLSMVLPSNAFSMLLFGVAPPVGLSANVMRVVILEVGQRVPPAVFIAAASQSSLVVVVHAVEVPHVWKMYHAAEGTMVLLRPDWVVEARTAQWSDEFGRRVAHATSSGSIIMAGARSSNGAGLVTALDSWTMASFESAHNVGPRKVHLWDSLSSQASIYWILFNAQIQFTSQHRDELLRRVSAQLGRFISTDTKGLAKALFLQCVTQNIQVFELQDIVEKCVSDLQSVVTKLSSRNSSQTSMKSSEEK